MEIEYGRKTEFVFGFETWEMHLIAKSIKPEIKRIEEKITTLEEHPENEGQITFQVKIEEHRRKIRAIQEIIREFSI